MFGFHPEADMHWSEADAGMQSLDVFASKSQGFQRHMCNNKDIPVDKQTQQRRIWTFQSPNSLGEPGLILRGYAKEGPEPLVGAAGHGKNTCFEGVIQYGRRYTGEHSWLDSGGHRRLQEVVTTVRPAAWKGAVGTRGLMWNGQKIVFTWMHQGVLCTFFVWRGFKD